MNKRLLIGFVALLAIAGPVLASNFENIDVTEWLGDDPYIAFSQQDGVDVFTLELDDADANAVCLVLDMPAGDSTNVPVFLITSTKDTDYGYFNGYTQPTFAIEDDDGDSWITISYSADDTPAIAVGGAASTISIPGITAYSFTDNVDVALGTGSPASIEYTTADANANCIIFDLPAGGATDVPVVLIAQTDADFGYFNGYTETAFAIEDTDGDSWFGITFSADDTPIFDVGGSATTVGFVDNVLFGVDGTGVDATFRGDTTGDYIIWDQSLDTLVCVDGNVKLDDDAILYFGTGTNVTTADGDFTVNFTDGTPGYLTLAAVANEDVFQIGDGTIATDVLIQNTTTAGADIFWDDSGELWKFGADNVGVDVGFYGDTAGDFILFDEDADELIVEDIKVNIMDDTLLTFGDADDITIQYDEDGNNDLQITGTVGFDGDVNFGIDATGVDVTFFGDTTLYKVWFDQNGDTNGAWFFGADDYGVDVSFYGVTASQGVTWDASADA